nr:hypothetical protein [Fangzheng tombus-like virus]
MDPMSGVTATTLDRSRVRGQILGAGARARLTQTRACLSRVWDALPKGAGWRWPTRHAKRVMTGSLSTGHPLVLANRFEQLPFDTATDLELAEPFVAQQPRRARPPRPRRRCSSASTRTASVGSQVSGTEPQSVTAARPLESGTEQQVPEVTEMPEEPVGGEPRPCPNGMSALEPTIEPTERPSEETGGVVDNSATGSFSDLVIPDLPEIGLGVEVGVSTESPHEVVDQAVGPDETKYRPPLRPHAGAREGRLPKDTEMSPVFMPESGEVLERHARRPWYAALLRSFRPRLIKGVDHDLLWYLRLEAAWEPRVPALCLSLKRKARAWLMQWDLSELTNEEVTLLILRTVTAALVPCEAETESRQFWMRDGNHQELTDATRFAKEGVLGEKTRRFLCMPVGTRTRKLDK